MKDFVDTKGQSRVIIDHTTIKL